MSKIVFLDTETTGLSLDDEIWEIAMIVRDPVPWVEDVVIQGFVQHDLAKAARLPESFRADHDERYDATSAWPARSAAALVAEVTHKAHIVGAVPNFDTERLALLLRAHGFEPTWHYHLIDVEALAVGFLSGADHWSNVSVPDVARTLPWRSEDLSLAVGIDPETFERHTALGDAAWAKAIYDAICTW